MTVNCESTRPWKEKRREEMVEGGRYGDGSEGQGDRR